MNPFLKALDVLDERGWYQGGYEGPGGRVCVQGAINCALNGAPRFLSGESFQASMLLGRVLGTQFIGTFNDDPTTSEEDVRLLLKHAAEKWDER